jgi:hypothetical protein
MDDGPGPPDALRLLRRLSYTKQFRVHWAVTLGARLYEPDEAAAAIALARRNLHTKGKWWAWLLILVVYFGIFGTAVFELTSSLIGRIIGIVILVLFTFIWLLYGRWMLRRAVTRNLETLRNDAGPGSS